MSASNTRFCNTYSLYVATVLITAACGLIIEIVAGRMLAPYLGMSIYTWTAIIAVVLAGFSVGHWVGGLIAEWPRRKAEESMVWILLGASISSAASLVLIRLLSGPILSAGMSPVPTIIFLTSALFFLPSFFVGIPSPVLTKLAIDQSPDRTGRRLGAMYAAGALGSIFGTLAAGFVFISWLGTIKTVLFVAAIYFALSVIYFFKTHDRANKSALASFGAGVLILIGISALGGRVQAFTSNCLKESQYYCIRIVDIEGPETIGAEISDARLMILDHLGHSMSVKSSPETLLASYVELKNVLIRDRFDRDTALQAFFIGGGGYTLPRAWLKQFPYGQMRVSEVDPEVTVVAKKMMWLIPSERLSVVHSDARATLLRQAETYHVIVGDAFHDISVPQHLVTREFFKLVKSRLRSDGLYIMNVVDHLQRPRLLLSVVKTLSEHFPVVEVWIDADHMRTGGRETFIVMAGQKASSNARFKSRRFKDRVWLRLKTGLGDKKTIARLNPITLTDDFAPVDRLIGDH